MYDYGWTTRKSILSSHKRVAGITSLIGNAIVLVYSFTGEESGVRFSIGASTVENDTATVYLISYAVWISNCHFETIAQLFITTLMFCDAFLYAHECKLLV